MIVRHRENWARGKPPEALTRSVISEHLTLLPRLERLRRYYMGEHEINARARRSGLPNNKLAHGFPRYIATMAAGYLIGSPVTYSTDARAEPLDALISRYRRAAIDSVDAELARDASVFGKGVELLFADNEAEPRAAALDPRSAFVVYDDTVEAKPLLGVHYSPITDLSGAIERYSISVYTDRLILRYEAKTLSRVELGGLTSVRPHFFGSVPLIEYWNDEDERGDFECVLSLIDAYDALQSDRLNDKQQFVDALLLLYGCTLETDAMGRSPGQQLREDKALALPDCDARAEWLCKQLNEEDTEVLKNALRADIHKMSMVPDLTDEHFSYNASGVAMKYKLLGFEQLIKIKERWFREALTERLKLFSAFLEKKGVSAPDVMRIKLKFTRALPVNELEEAQTASLLHGLIDDAALTARVESRLLT